MKHFFEEYYISVINKKLNQYVLNNWDNILVELFNEDHNKMDQLNDITHQCIEANRKDIYDQYINGLLINKG